MVFTFRLQRFSMQRRRNRNDQNIWSFDIHSSRRIYLLVWVSTCLFSCSPLSPSYPDCGCSSCRLVNGWTSDIVEIKRMKQLRPRVTQGELIFIVRSLKVHQEYCERKESEMKLRQQEMETLKGQIKVVGFGPEFDRLRELKKQRLHTWRDRYWKDGRVACILRVRFEKFLKGEIQHSANLTTRFLGTEKE